MSEQSDNKNPWVEKLEQVDLNDLSLGWSNMQVILDEEMPLQKTKDWKRWLILSILLLLLIGVCRCPGLLRNSKNLAQQHATVQHPAISDGNPEDAGSAHDDHSTSKGKAKPTNSETRDLKSEPQSAVIQRPDVNEKGLPAIVSGVYRDSSPNAISKDAKQLNRINSSVHPHIPSNLSNNSTHKSARSSKRQSVAKNKSPNQPKNFAWRDKSGAKKKWSSQSVEETQENQSKAIHHSGAPNASLSDKSLVQQSISVDSLNSDTAGAAKPPLNQADSGRKASNAAVSKVIVTQAKNDSTARKQTPLKKHAIAWSFGLGLNQAFAVGSQQYKNYNIDGGNSFLSNYIPVPMLRLYLNSRFSLQLEAQFKAPQYTKELLVKRELILDSLTNPLSLLPNQNSVYIEKLFYFNLPLIAHYRLWKNLNLGAGLEYARLTNGVGYFDLKTLSRSTGNYDSTISAKLLSLKTDPVYREIKSNEWRFLLEADYQWKNLDIGVRYNEAFSDFINISITSTQTTKGINNSIQLYIRYVLWKSRKARVLLAK